MTDPIKVKIQELCPDARNTILYEGRKGWQYGYRDRDMYWSNPFHTKEEAHLAAIEFGHSTEKDITLAIVFRAMQKAHIHIPDMHLTLNSGFCLQTGKDAFWNLAQDNYDKQTRETQLFIGSLLGVEK